MTIHLTKELESNILAAVHSGRYASLNDAMCEAASFLTYYSGHGPVLTCLMCVPLWSKPTGMAAVQ
jgi:hypothetical protein